MGVSPSYSIKAPFLLNPPSLMNWIFNLNTPLDGFASVTPNFYQLIMINAKVRELVKGLGQHLSSTDWSKPSVFQTEKKTEFAPEVLF